MVGPSPCRPASCRLAPTAGMSCEPSPSCALLLRSFARAVRGRMMCLCFRLFCSALLFFAKFGVCSALLRSAACAPAWDWFFICLAMRGSVLLYFWSAVFLGKGICTQKQRDDTAHGNSCRRKAFNCQAWIKDVDYQKSTAFADGHTASNAPDLF